LHVRDQSSDGNHIAGNCIGTNAAGMGAIRNGGAGVFIDDSSGHTIGTTGGGVSDDIAGYLISGTGDAADESDAGILLSQASGCVVAGNLVGVAALDSIIDACNDDAKPVA